MHKSMRSIGDRIFDTINSILLFIMIVIFIYPLLEILVLSFDSPIGVTRLGIKLWPEEPTFASYKEVIKAKVIYTGYYNTIIRTTIGTFLTIMVTFCGGYVLTKKQLPHRKLILIYILITMFFSGGLIPTFLNIRNLGLIDSRWSLILPPMTSAWYLLITRNFIAAIPIDIEESASIDGANPIFIVFRILLPISLPIVAILGLWAAIDHWNAWFDSMIYIRSNSKQVLQLILRRILIEQQRALLEADDYTSSYATTPQSVQAALIVITIGPIVLVYPFIQKYFIKGIMVGSLKG